MGDSLGEVAGTTPGPAPGAVAGDIDHSSHSSSAGRYERAALVEIGDSYITPVGFMDMMLVSRSTDPGTGIGTNFGAAFRTAIRSRAP